MKQKLMRLSQEYVAALGKHLRRTSPASLLPALALGQEAVAIGLGTLDLAKMHEQALGFLGARVYPAGKRALMTKRAGHFFDQANLAIEETHRLVRLAKADLSQVKKTLGRRTQELASTHRQLQKGVLQRQIREDAIAKNGRYHDQCLEESLQLQKRLRLLTHRVIAAQEHERTKISHELQDEIVQTLVGINVRLLSLKQAARTNIKDLKNHIASTQRLVVKSAKSVRLFARTLETPLRAPEKRSMAAP